MRLAGVLLAALVAGCSGVAQQAPPSPESPPVASSTSLESAPEPASSAVVARASAFVSGGIVGSWHRTILCDEARKALADAGLLESHPDWTCAEGSPPKPHSHFFTEDGRFGSYDPGRVQVDDGDYILVDADTLAFPSHSREFGFDPILVHVALVDGNLTFTVKVPDNCTGTCADAYAWALSAFGTNPWQRGELPK